MEGWREGEGERGSNMDQDDQAIRCLQQEACVGQQHLQLPTPRNGNPLYILPPHAHPLLIEGARECWGAEDRWRKAEEHKNKVEEAIDEEGRDKETQ